MKFNLIFAALAIFSLSAGADIVPQNDLYIPVGTKFLQGGLTEDEFNAVIEKVETIYAPVVASMGAKLRINRLWDNGNVNAIASRVSNTWIVDMYGGLARHSTITSDALALVVCHELGHHLGGAPKKLNRSNPTLSSWSTSEGQADYFSTLKCLRKVFLHDDNGIATRQLDVPAHLSKLCSKSWPNSVERNICIRSSMAGASVAALFTSLTNGRAAQFNTPDPRAVAQIVHSHPATQCRLDTFLAGALCETHFGEDVSQSEEVQGTCHKFLGHQTGLRPNCWFVPSVN